MDSSGFDPEAGSAAPTAVGSSWAAHSSGSGASSPSMLSGNGGAASAHSAATIRKLLIIIAAGLLLFLFSGETRYMVLILTICVGGLAFVQFLSK